MKAACISKDSDPAEQSEGHEKGETGPALEGRFCIRKQQEDIHGDAAELKRKISPVIGAVIQKKSQTGLLPDFGNKHQQPADPEQRSEAVREGLGCSENSDHNKNLLLS